MIMKIRIAIASISMMMIVMMTMWRVMIEIVMNLVW